MMSLTPAANHTGWLGPMDYWHRNAPPPFNPAYDPGAPARRARVEFDPENDGTQPWKSYSNGTAGRHFATEEQAMAWVGEGF